MLVATVILLAGCSGGLPEIRQESLAQQIRNIPKDAAPLYSWQGSRDDLKTYWGDQAVSVRVKAFLPEKTWQQAGDGYWQVSAENSEGTRIPFIGVIHKYADQSGKESAVFLPPLDLNKAPDGLYLVIIPNIEMREGKIASIRPEASLREIRNHCFKPFAAPVPLIPQQESALTPKPAPRPAPPPGTPIPID